MFDSLKKFAVFLLAMTAILLTAAEWRVESPRPGVLELANDNNSWGGLNPFDVLPCNGSACIAAKVFPLKKLPAGSLEKADKVYLKLHIGVFDYSTVINKEAPNGLTEKFRIRFDGGKEIVLNTSDPRLPARSATSNRLNDWVEIPIDKSLLLNREKISVTITKVDDGDDFIYPSVDRSGIPRVLSVAMAAKPGAGTGTAPSISTAASS